MNWNAEGLLESRCFAPDLESPRKDIDELTVQIVQPLANSLELAELALIG
jgi:hypothetical protein